LRPKGIASILSLTTNVAYARRFVVSQHLTPDFVPFLFDTTPEIVNTGVQILVAIMLVLLAFELLAL